MPYGTCAVCRVTRINVSTETTGRAGMERTYRTRNAPYYCEDCQTKLYEAEFEEMRQLKEKIEDPLLRQLAEQMITESKEMILPKPPAAPLQ